MNRSGGCRSQWGYRLAGSKASWATYNSSWSVGVGSQVRIMMVTCGGSHHLDLVSSDYSSDLIWIRRCRRLMWTAFFCLLSVISGLTWLRTLNFLVSLLPRIQLACCWYRKPHRVTHLEPANAWMFVISHLLTLGSFNQIWCYQVLKFSQFWLTHRI